jgi:hypothetical protein
LADQHQQRQEQRYIWSSMQATLLQNRPLVTWTKWAIAPEKMVPRTKV